MSITGYVPDASTYGVKVYNNGAEEPLEEVPYTELVENLTIRTRYSRGMILWACPKTEYAKTQIIECTLNLNAFKQSNLQLQNKKMELLCYKKSIINNATELDTRIKTVTIHSEECEEKSNIRFVGSIKFPLALTTFKERVYWSIAVKINNLILRYIVTDICVSSRPGPGGVPKDATDKPFWFYHIKGLLPNQKKRKPIEEDETEDDVECASPASPIASPPIKRTKEAKEPPPQITTSALPQVAEAAVPRSNPNGEFINTVLKLHSLYSECSYHIDCYLKKYPQNNIHPIWCTHRQNYDRMMNAIADLYRVNNGNAIESLNTISQRSDVRTELAALPLEHFASVNAETEATEDSLENDYIFADLF